MNRLRKDKNPWIKTKAKPGPKKKKTQLTFFNKKRKNLLDGDKDLWFDQRSKFPKKDVEKAVSSSPASLPGASSKKLHRVSFHRLLSCQPLVPPCNLAPRFCFSLLLQFSFLWFSHSCYHWKIGARELYVTRMKRD